MDGMEAVSLPMISLPSKETCEASFIGLKPLISGCYGEDPDSFDTEIKQLDGMRQTHVTKDYAGCSLLRKYFAQLHLLSARFPKSITGGGMLLEFKWKDAFTGKHYLQEGITMEQASVLFNLAALHSQLGANNNRLTEQEIKEACTHFQCATGVLIYLYDNFGSNYCKDMAPDLIEMFKTLMLAQAQECYVEKSIKFSSGVKHATIAKLAAKLYEYYQFVHASLESDGAISVVKVFKEWPRVAQIKTQYYLALSHFFQGSVCKEQAKYGEMVVYHIAAVQVLEKIGKLPKGINENLKKAVLWLTDAAKKEATESKKQNDFVYHEKLPPMEHLEAVQGVALAKANVFQPADPAVIGADIFNRLVPMAAHEQSSVYSEEKAKLLRDVVSKVEEKDTALDQYLGGLNIAEVWKTQQYKPIIPVQIKQKVAWFQQHIEDVNNLRVQLEKLKATCSHVDELLKVVNARKEGEEKNEKGFQSRHGPRAESQVCKELWHELDSCLKYHCKAAQSNTELDALYHQHSININLLTDSLESILSSLPTVSLLEAPTIEDTDAKRLDVVMEEVDKMKKQRKELTTQLRDQMSRDDITTSIIGQKDDEQEVSMSQRLQKHKDLVSIIEQNLTAQENILQILTDVNAKHAILREVQQDISGKQEQYFGAILQSADVFPVLQTKVMEGLRFFTQLEDKVVKLQRRTNDICDHQQRKREAQDRSTPATPIAPSSTTSHDLPPVRPPKRDDQRGGPLTNQSTAIQPHPLLLTTGGDIEMPIDVQPSTSHPHPSVGEQQELLSPQQQEPSPQQAGFPSQQLQPPTEQLPSQQVPNMMREQQATLVWQQPQAQVAIEQPAFPTGVPYLQQVLPPTKPEIPPVQLGLPSTQPEIASSVFPKQLGILPIPQPRLSSDEQLTSGHGMYPSQQSTDIVHSAMVDSTSSAVPTTSVTITAEFSPASVPMATTGTSHTTSSVGSLGIGGISMATSDASMVTSSQPIVTKEVTSSVAEMVTSISGNMTSEDADAVSTSQATSLDQLNAFALLGEVRASSIPENENDKLNHAIPTTAARGGDSVVTTIQAAKVTSTIDTLLQQQQEQHSMELRKETVFLLEQLELRKREQEMSGSHTAMLQLVQQQQQSIHQQQVAIQQHHKENNILRQDRDMIETKYRSLVAEEQNKQQTLHQQLAQQTNEYQRCKQQVEGQQQHIQQLNHALKMLDDQNKHLTQQHASQVAHLEQQYKLQIANVEEKNRLAFNRLQQEFRAAENNYKQEIDQLNQQIMALRQQQQQTAYQQPVPKANLGQHPMTPQSRPLHSPQQSYLPSISAYSTGVTYPAQQLHGQQPSMQQPHPQQPSVQQPRPQQPSVQQLHPQQPSVQQLHPQQPSMQQPHPQQPSMQQQNTPTFYTQASQQPNTFQKLPPRP